MTLDDALVGLTDSGDKEVREREVAHALERIVVWLGEQGDDESALHTLRVLLRALAAYVRGDEAAADRPALRLVKS